MNAAMPSDTRFDILNLALAMKHSNALDAVPLNLQDAQWRQLADYLQPVNLQQGQVLIEQGVKDRTVYFVESGGLTVHYEDDKDRIRLAWWDRGRCSVKARSSAICRAVPQSPPAAPAGCGASRPCVFVNSRHGFQSWRWN